MGSKNQLRHDRLYLGDNGRVFCGILQHAGATASMTGRDISGQRVQEISDAEAEEFNLGCEGCRAIDRRVERDERPCHQRD